MRYPCHLPNGGSAPATPGFNAVAPEWQYGAADAAPAVPAAESTLGSHPCVALSSAQVLPEWPTSTPLCNDFSSNGDYPLNLVSHSRGSLQFYQFGNHGPRFDRLGRAGCVINTRRSGCPCFYAVFMFLSDCSRNLVRSDLRARGIEAQGVGHRGVHPDCHRHSSIREDFDY
jgi:hypothetical protein